MSDSIECLTDGILVSVHSRKKETALRTNHTHNYNEIYFLCTGTARFFAGNEIINIRQGDIVFMKNGILHKTMYNAGEYSKRLLICFNDDFAGNEYKKIINDMGNKKYIVLPPLKSIETEKLIQKLYDEYTAKKPYYIQMCKCMLGELLVTLCRLDETNNIKTLSTNDITMQSAAKYIAENFAQDFSLKNLADKFAMSPSYFSKTFKSATGFGVSEYINAVRLENAEKLLCSRKKSITDVALKCGFNDSNYFATLFKKRYGVSPRNYFDMKKQDL